jgi:hypothetical protein
MNHQEELLKAFRIGPEDLAANRLGQLGPAQKRSLLNAGMGNIIGALFIGLFLALILYGVANKPLVPAQWITASVLFLAALAAGVGYYFQTRQAVKAGRVESLTGPITVRSRGRSGWFLTVAGQSFRLPVRPWQVQPETVYRVYFVSKMRQIVAIEPVSVA